MRYDHQGTAEIMRLLLVAGFCMGVIFGVFVTGLLMVLRR